ncbi:MAG: hypothetical protein J7K54_04765 [Candidatus Aenigmarchaeota archaeon]|nr:hypothetical protein [Candidatus Aenigmarchaeota archaeon]
MNNRFLLGAFILSTILLFAQLSQSIGSSSYNTTGAVTAGGGNASSTNYISLVYVLESGGNATSSSFETTVGQFHSSSQNTAPDTQQVVLNTTGNTNRTSDDLDCWARATDPEDSTLEAYVDWWNGTTLKFSYYYTGISEGVLTKLSTLAYGNTSKGEVWNCSVFFSDGTKNESDWNNASLTILNTPPDQIVLSAPESGNTTTNRTPAFSWVEGTDDDSDSLTYYLNLTCGYLGGGTDCSDDNHLTLVQNGNCSAGFCNFTIPYELKYFGDDNYYYNWSVRAYDQEDYGTWSSTRNITINTNVAITLYNDTVQFGAILLGQSNDTTDDSPEPFRIRNDGNCFVDVNLSSSDLMWDTHPEPSSYYMYKVDNVTGEENSLNWSSPNTTSSWSPVPDVNGSAMSFFNYSDATDEAEIDLYIEPPSGEPAGVKTSTLLFTAGYHSEYQ